MPYDYISILIKGRNLVADHRAELAPDPFGGQLDRGQGVLDFMCDAPRHVAPGRHTLRTHQVCNVIESDHIALQMPGIAAAHRHAHEKTFKPPVARNLDFLLHDDAGTAAQPLEQVNQFRGRVAKVTAVIAPFLDAKQPLRRAVDEVDPALCVTSDNAGGDRRQNRVKLTPPRLGLAVVLDQRLALPLQLPRHLVEDAAQHGNFIVALFLLHLHVQIAGADPLRGTRQTPNGARKALGKPEAQPYRREDEDQRKAQIEQPELEQQATALALKLLIQVDGLLGFIQQFQYLAIHDARNVEIAIDIRGQRDQRAQLVIIPIIDQNRLALLRFCNVRGGGCRVIEKVRAFAARADHALAIDHISTPQAALNLCLTVGQKLAQIAVTNEEISVMSPIEKLREGVRIHRQIVAMFALVGLRG
ncbi:hypothetical protein GALL_417550 [mine drainage metagenome]|uniref:Uncharacterized protein n=1 Tax=mine drainage metagenome TaxID=410659 RepID=A0A1J5PZZ9_9ZZZZ